MFSLPLRARGARRIYPCIFLAAFMASVAADSYAQIGATDTSPNMGIGNRGSARNTVQGYIILPSGRRLDKRVKVRITGATGGSLTGMTDDSGSFTFRRLAGGTYFLTVDAGTEYELANETVDIIDASRGAGQTITLHIQLQPRMERAAQKAGTVNAAFAGVPKPALELYKKGVEAAVAGDSKKAVEHLTGALELHPEFTLALNELGLQYMRLNQPEKAEEALLSALRLAPESFAPRLNYGVLLVHVKKFAEAEAELRRAIERNGGSAAAHLYMGRALIGLRKYGESARELQRAISIGGGVNLAHRYLAVAYIELGENERAVEELEEYLRLEPKAKDADAVRRVVTQMRAQASAGKK